MLKRYLSQQKSTTPSSDVKQVQLKVCLYNVHSFSDREFNDTIDEMIQFFKKHDFDIIALTEATKKSENDLQKVAKALSYNYEFAPAEWATFGNAILTKHAIRDSKATKLIVPNAGHRSMLKVSIAEPGCPTCPPLPVDFYVTHLDHINEENRLGQLAQAFAAVDYSKTHVMMGDFNALTKEDYTVPYMLKNIYHVRKSTKWELPRFELTNVIRSKGYVDLFQVFNELYGGNLKDRDLSTCFFHTRIDYFYAYLTKNAQVFVDEAKIHQDNKSSDHSPITMKLTIQYPASKQ